MDVALRLDRACRLLNERYLEPVVLEDVADILGGSRPAASRLFRRAMGHRMMEYLHEPRAFRKLLRSVVA